MAGLRIYEIDALVSETVRRLDNLRGNAVENYKQSDEFEANMREITNSPEFKNALHVVNLQLQIAKLNKEVQDAKNASGNFKVYVGSVIYDEKSRDIVLNKLQKNAEAIAIKERVPEPISPGTVKQEIILASLDGDTSNIIETLVDKFGGDY